MKKKFILFLLLQSVMNILAQNATYVDKSIKFEMTNDYQELITETLLDNNTRELECLRFIIVDSVMGEKSISFGKGGTVYYEKKGKLNLVMPIIPFSAYVLFILKTLHTQRMIL